MLEGMNKKVFRSSVNFSIKTVKYSLCQIIGFERVVADHTLCISTLRWHKTNTDNYYY